MDLGSHLRVIGQNWLRILLIAGLIAVSIFLWSNSKSRVYEATETLSVTPGSTNGGQTTADQANYLAQSYATFVDSPSVVRQAVRDSKLDITTDEGFGRLSAAADPTLGFLTLKASGPSRQDAEALVGAGSQALIDTVSQQQESALAFDLVPIQVQRTQLQQQLDALPAGSSQRASIQANLDALNQAEAQRRAQPANRVNILSGAISSATPVSPRPSRDAFLAFLAAGVIVAELTVAAFALGDRFSKSDDAADVTRITGLPVLAKIPKGTGFEVVEAFRVLRTNLMVLEGAGKPRTIAVVSSNQNAGKTFTAVHLAQSAAALDEKVVLVDADLRKPTVHERVGVPRAPGLSAVLQGGDLASSLRKVPDSPFLRVLPSGAPVQDASGVLGARAFRQVLDSLRAVRLVVVDTPPAGLFADAMAVASQCDATIFVLDIKTSRRRQVRQALESLERGGANLVGVVVNRTSTPRRASYYEG